MSHPMDFDESNDEFMCALGTSMATIIPQEFPGEIQAKDSQLQLKYETESRLSTESKSQFIEIIDECMGDLYREKKGKEWKVEKMEEFASPGLVFVWYEQDLKPVCFLSLRLCEEEHGQCLYLYEIQVLPQLQGLSAGKTLLSCFHNFSRHLHSLSRSPDFQNFSNSSTALTVFSDNEKALSWYHRHGYEIAPDSPTDRVMRSGKVIKPDYYILYRKRDSLIN